MHFSYGIIAYKIFLTYPEIFKGFLISSGRLPVEYAEAPHSWGFLFVEGCVDLEMIRYISLLMFIGLAFWSCDDQYNKKNEIISITSSVSEVKGGRTVELACEATDQDGDKLTYFWESASGSLDQYGDSATWTAPADTGVYFITCTVSDDYGASAVGSIAIRVLSAQSVELKGKVSNALNGAGVPGVLVTVGDITAITNENGDYNIGLIFFGEYDITGEVEEFCPYSGHFIIPDDNSLDIFIFNFSVSPIPEPGETRMVLNWGAEPRDLDSHLLTPEIEGTTHHISYMNRGSETAAPYVTLDTDNTQGYGPETITIKQSFEGTYIYYIKNYSNDETLANSGGTIQIYNSPDCDGETIEVPNEGSGRYWYVCDIDGASGNITIVNQIQEAEPAP